MKIKITFVFVFFLIINSEQLKATKVFLNIYSTYCALNGHPYVGDTVVFKYLATDNLKQNVVLLTKDSLFPTTGCTSYDGINAATLAPFEMPLFGTNFFNGFYNLISIDPITSYLIPYQVPPTCTNKQFAVAWNKQAQNLGCGGLNSLIYITNFPLINNNLSCPPGPPSGPFNNNNLYINNNIISSKVYVVDTLSINNYALLTDYVRLVIDWNDGSLSDTIIDQLSNVGSMHPTNSNYFIFNKLIGAQFTPVQNPNSLFSHTYTTSISTNSIAAITVKYTYANTRCFPHNFDATVFTQRTYCLPPQTIVTDNGNSHSFYLNDLEAKLFPNPTTDILKINSSAEITKIEVVNSIGQIVLTQNALNTSLDLSGLKKGIYFVHFYSPQGNAIKKIVKE